MGMLGGGGETLLSWRWMLPHVSLCVWCVPPVGSVVGRHEGCGGKTVNVCVCLPVCVCVCVCYWKEGQVRGREETMKTETPERLVFHPRLIIYWSSPLSPSFLPHSANFFSFPLTGHELQTFFFHFFKSTHTDLTYVGNDTSVSYWFFLGLLCVFSFLLSPSLPPPFFKHCLPSLSLLYSRKASCPPIPSSLFFSLSFFL